MKELHVRKSIRLANRDYSRAGRYFVTICVKDRHEMLGQLVGTTAPGRPPPPVHNHPRNGAYVELSEIGRCVDETIQNANRGNVRIDKYVIMPNHVHLIAALGNGDAVRNADDRGRSSLQQVVRNIKSFVTKNAGFKLWQPRFHDHIIRDDGEFLRIWQYIDENPARWKEDCYHPK